MTKEDAYVQLADALDRLPRGFPRTPSKMELSLLKKIFSPEEATLASQLGRDMESLDVIAERVKLPLEEVRIRLEKMVKRRLVNSDKQAGKLRFRLANINLTHTWVMDHEYAHLLEKYFADGAAVELKKHQPPRQRVVPAQRTVKAEWLLPYDDLQAMLQAAKSLRVIDCECRTQQDYLGRRRCTFPTKTCLMLYSDELPSSPDDVSQEEAIALFDQAEEMGLVHMVYNIMKGVYFICNCCSCCCIMLRGITDWGIENSVAYANYYAVIDSEECIGCGTCIDRCQVQAISEQDEVAVVDRERCIGCGVCVTGCPEEVAKLQRKPDAEIVDPPTDFATWEQERLRNRGLIK